ncbi:cystein-rich protein [Gentian ovary ringspot virus]|uniref:Cystein-rich protein n=1 Tax=Gentian ovary ringspot virus TaxID=1920772 RepID=A0A077JM47_9VIRU|nr:cystein-rich protein [Gentian ovary ringspot virus]BAP18648.1 cystein-rich protein [Gentian ovary ringspot virus]
MDILEKLERKEAMRNEYRRRESIIRRHDLNANVCLVTSKFNVPCGMLPAVSEDEKGNVVYYHGGCCSEVHYNLFVDLCVGNDDVIKRKDAERAVMKVVNQFSDKITNLIEQYGKEEVFDLLNIIIK